jgi:hypothetical protein
MEPSAVVPKVEGATTVTARVLTEGEVTVMVLPTGLGAVPSEPPEYSSLVQGVLPECSTHLRTPEVHLLFLVWRKSISSVVPR